MNTSSTEILTSVAGGSQQSRASAHSKNKPKTIQVLVGWDKARSFTYLGLLLCFVVWASIYFPLINREMEDHSAHH